MARSRFLEGFFGVVILDHCRLYLPINGVCFKEWIIGAIFVRQIVKFI